MIPSQRPFPKVVNDSATLSNGMARSVYPVTCVVSLEQLPEKQEANLLRSQALAAQAMQQQRAQVSTRSAMANPSQRRKIVRPPPITVAKGHIIDIDAHRSKWRAGMKPIKVTAVHQSGKASINGTKSAVKIAHHQEGLWPPAQVNVNRLEGTTSPVKAVVPYRHTSPEKRKLDATADRQSRQINGQPVVVIERCTFEERGKIYPGDQFVPERRPEASEMKGVVCPERRETEHLDYLPRTAPVKPFEIVEKREPIGYDTSDQSCWQMGLDFFQKTSDGDWIDHTISATQTTLRYPNHVQTMSGNHGGQIPVIICEHRDLPSKPFFPRNHLVKLPDEKSRNRVERTLLGIEKTMFELRHSTNPSVTAMENGERRLLPNNPVLALQLKKSCRDGSEMLSINLNRRIPSLPTRPKLEVHRDIALEVFADPSYAINETAIPEIAENPCALPVPDYSAVVSEELMPQADCFFCDSVDDMPPNKWVIREAVEICEEESDCLAEENPADKNFTHRLQKDDFESVPAVQKPENLERLKWQQGIHTAGEDCFSALEEMNETKKSNKKLHEGVVCVTVDYKETSNCKIQEVQIECESNKKGVLSEDIVHPKTDHKKSSGCGVQEVHIEKKQTQKRNTEHAPAVVRCTCGATEHAAIYPNQPLAVDALLPKVTSMCKNKRRLSKDEMRAESSKNSPLEAELFVKGSREDSKRVAPSQKATAGACIVIVHSEASTVSGHQQRKSLTGTVAENDLERVRKVASRETAATGMDLKRRSIEAQPESTPCKTKVDGPKGKRRKSEGLMRTLEKNSQFRHDNGEKNRTTEVILDIGSKRRGIKVQPESSMCNGLLKLNVDKPERETQRSEDMIPTQGKNQWVKKSTEGVDRIRTAVLNTDLKKQGTEARSESTVNISSKSNIGGKPKEINALTPMPNKIQRVVWHAETSKTAVPSKDSKGHKHNTELLLKSTISSCGKTKTDNGSMKERNESRDMVTTEKIVSPVGRVSTEGILDIDSNVSKDGLRPTVSRHPNAKIVNKPKKKRNRSKDMLPTLAMSEQLSHSGSNSTAETHTDSSEHKVDVRPQSTVVKHRKTKIDDKPRKKRRVSTDMTSTIEKHQKVAKSKGTAACFSLKKHRIEKQPAPSIDNSFRKTEINDKPKEKRKRLKDMSRQERVQGIHVDSAEMILSVGSEECGIEAPPESTVDEEKRKGLKGMMPEAEKNRHVVQHKSNGTVQPRMDSNGYDMEASLKFASDSSQKTKVTKPNVRRGSKDVMPASEKNRQKVCHVGTNGTAAPGMDSKRRVNTPLGCSANRLQSTKIDDGPKETEKRSSNVMQIRKSNQNEIDRPKNEETAKKTTVLENKPNGLMADTLSTFTINCSRKIKIANKSKKKRKKSKDVMPVSEKMGRNGTAVLGVDSKSRNAHTPSESTANSLQSSKIDDIPKAGEKRSSVAVLENDREKVDRTEKHEAAEGILLLDDSSNGHMDKSLPKFTIDSPQKPKIVDKPKKKQRRSKYMMSVLKKSRLEPSEINRSMELGINSMRYSIPAQPESIMNNSQHKTKIDKSKTDRVSKKNMILMVQKKSNQVEQSMSNGTTAPGIDSNRYKIEAPPVSANGSSRKMRTDDKPKKRSSRDRVPAQENNQNLADQNERSETVIGMLGIDSNGCRSETLPKRKQKSDDDIRNVCQNNSRNSKNLFLNLPSTSLERNKFSNNSNHSQLTKNRHKKMEKLDRSATVSSKGNNKRLLALGIDSKGGKTKAQLEESCGFAKALNHFQPAENEHRPRKRRKKSETSVSGGSNKESQILVGRMTRKPDRKKFNDSEDPTRYACAYCRRVLNSAVAYTNHVQTHACTCPIPCPVCGRCFTVNSAVKRHLEEDHDSNKRHNCSSCGRGFVHLKAYKRHIRIHIKPFYCRKCKARFARHSLFLRHLTSHSEKQYPCGKCEEVYFKQSQWGDHVKAHACDGKATATDLRPQTQSVPPLMKLTIRKSGPFFCEICGRSVMLWGSYKRHMKAHAKRKQFPCSKMVMVGFQKNKPTDGTVNFSRTGMPSNAMEPNGVGIQADTVKPGNNKGSSTDITTDAPVADLQLTSTTVGSAADKYTDVGMGASTEESCVVNAETDLLVKSTVRKSGPFFCEICGRSVMLWGSYKRHLRAHAKKKQSPCSKMVMVSFRKNKPTVGTVNFSRTSMPSSAMEPNGVGIQADTVKPGNNKGSNTDITTDALVADLQLTSTTVGSAADKYADIGMGASTEVSCVVNAKIDTLVAVNPPQDKERPTIPPFASQESTPGKKEEQDSSRQHLAKKKLRSCTKSVDIQDSDCKQREKCYSFRSSKATRQKYFDMEQTLQCSSYRATHGHFQDCVLDSLPMYVCKFCGEQFHPVSFVKHAGECEDITKRCKLKKGQESWSQKTGNTNSNECKVNVLVRGRGSKKKITPVDDKILEGKEGLQENRKTITQKQKQPRKTMKEMKGDTAAMDDDLIEITDGYMRCHAPGKAVHRCERCDILFASRRSCSEHFQQSHRPRTKATAVEKLSPFVCSMCSKSFRNEHILRRHSVSHSVMCYACNICHRVILAKVNAYRHVVGHINRGDFKDQ